MAPQEEKHEYKWYVLNTLSGQEFQAEQQLNERILQYGMGDYINKVVVPTEKVQDIRNGKKRVYTRKFYPGYMLVYMEMTSEAWQLVKKTNGVIGFLGGDKPKALTDSEAEEMFAQLEASKERIAPRISVVVGDRVKVTNGPFDGCDGLVEEIDEERGKLSVSVMVFNRSTKVELESWQVEKSEA